MTSVQITWQRTCEYVADVDTAELRELVSSLPNTGERADALIALDQLEGREGSYADWLVRHLGYYLGNTEAGRDYLGAMADDNPEFLGGTGAPEVTDISAAAGRETGQ